MFNHGTIRRAFTLVEVLVVVTIIAIAGAVVVPSMSNTGSLSVQAGARIIIADLLYAQNEAIARQRSRKVIFNTTTNSYRLATGDGTTLGVTWKGGVAASGNYIVDFNIDDRFRGVKLESATFGDDAEIVFDALGTPDTGGSVDIVFNNFRYRVTVAAMTGRITVAPVNGG